MHPHTLPTQKALEVTTSVLRLGLSGTQSRSVRNQSQSLRNQSQSLRNAISIPQESVSVSQERLFIPHERILFEMLIFLWVVVFMFHYSVSLYHNHTILKFLSLTSYPFSFLPVNEGSGYSCVMCEVHYGPYAACNCHFPHLVPYVCTGSVSCPDPTPCRTNWRQKLSFH